ncbi:hypothetical protein [Streptomyces sp. NPDC055287]
MSTQSPLPGGVRPVEFDVDDHDASRLALPPAGRGLRAAVERAPVYTLYESGPTSGHGRLCHALATASTVALCRSGVPTRQVLTMTTPASGRSIVGRVLTCALRTDMAASPPLGAPVRRALVLTVLEPEARSRSGVSESWS